MGFFGKDESDEGYENPLFTGCRVSVDESNPHRKVVKCSPKKIYQGKEYVPTEGRQFEAVIDEIKGKRVVDVIDDGGLPLAVTNKMIKVLERTKV